MKKLILTLFLFMQLFGNDGCKIIDEVEEEFVSFAEKKYNIKCCGTGASFPQKIESLYVKFEVDKALSVNESRILIVNLVNDFQKIINKKTKIQPLLAIIPFTADRINISLSLADDENSPPSDSFSHVFTARGNIIFSTCDLKKSIFDQKKIREPLEEACEKTGISISLIRSSYSDYDKEMNTPLKNKPKA